MVGQVITIVQELAGSRFSNLIVTSNVAYWDSLNWNPDPAFQVGSDPDQRFDDQKFKKIQLLKICLFDQKLQFTYP